MFQGLGTLSVSQEDATIGVRQGYCIKCLSGMQDGVFDKDAGVANVQGSWIECLTGMPN